MILKQIPLGELETNCYIFSADDRECCIIDPADEGAEIAQFVLQKQLVPKMILFTHGHLDHVLGAADLSAALARHGYHCMPAIHETELDHTGPGCLAVHTALLSVVDPTMMPRYSSMISRIPRAETVFSGGETIEGLGLKVMHTPGHSKGSVCLYQSELGILFSGDTLFQGSVGRTDLPGGSSRDMKLSLDTLKAAVPHNVKVYPGHGPSTDMERELKHNPYLR